MWKSYYLYYDPPLHLRFESKDPLSIKGHPFSKFTLALTGILIGIVEVVVLVKYMCNCSIVDNLGG